MGGDASQDEQMLATHAAALADAIEAALPGWSERKVVELVTAYRGSADDGVRARARAAGEEATAEIGPEVRALLAADVEEQRGNPLAIARRAVRFPTAVLRDAGVPEVLRDEFAERAFPDDVYDLSPASFAELDPSVHEPGLAWGAAKAHVVLARRRSRGDA